MASNFQKFISLTILNNDKTKFKAAIRKYIHIHLTAQMIFMCKEKL